MKSILGIKVLPMVKYFVQVDDFLTLASSNSLTDHGYVIGIPQGDHTLTVLYIGYGEDGIIYAKDTVVLQIRKSTDEFSEYKLHSIPIQIDANNTIASGMITPGIISNISVDVNSFTYIRNMISDPTIENFYVIINDSLVIRDDNFGFNIQNMENISLSIGAELNTTGFTGIQLSTTSQRANGITFLIDALGLHQLNTMQSASLSNGNNFVGLVSFSPNGIWSSKIPCPESSPCTGSVFGLADWDDEDQRINENADSSFDYVGAVQGIKFHFFVLDQDVNTHVQRNTINKSDLIGWMGGVLILSTVTILGFIIWKRRSQNG